jgi:hypothetical protein
MTAALPGTAARAGAVLVKTLPVPAANLSYVIDPALRRHGYGTSIVAALLASAGSISCLLKNGFQPLDLAPDWEGTIYYARERPTAPSCGQE